MLANGVPVCCTHVNLALVLHVYSKYTGNFCQHIGYNHVKEFLTNQLKLGLLENSKKYITYNENYAFRT